MSTPDPHCLEKILDQLDVVAPDAPLLALGQTILWDEPMKVGLLERMEALGRRRRFLAGIHDTDYFAKLPSERKSGKRFAAFPHNDTTTSDIWSAAGEFNALFGSETVIRRADLQKFGARVHVVNEARPQHLDHATEAFGWRGVVSLEENPPITGEVPLKEVRSTLRSTLVWALEQTVGTLSNGSRKAAEAKAEELLVTFEATADAYPEQTLADFYERLAPSMAAFVGADPSWIETTRTSKLLQFNSLTADRPRFELVQRFLDPETRWQAIGAYNDALKGTEIYGLDRFGTGAIPFDLVIPGIGRGTLRVGNRGIVIMTPVPQFITLKQPVWTVGELAAAIERKFGQNCVLIGKAVTLIGMLSREFVFVFHEGASSYVKHSVGFHERLIQLGLGLQWNPILRVAYDTWGTMGAFCSWIRLPAPFQVPFGAEELCTPSFASRWKQVAQEQRGMLQTLSTLRRPVELIDFINTYRGGAWSQMAKEYDEQHQLIAVYLESLEMVRQQRLQAYADLRELKLRRVAKEKETGDHFRKHIFEQSPTPEALAEREIHLAELAEVQQELRALKLEIRKLLRQQSDIARSSEVVRAHAQRRNIELEAEIKRIKIIRDATVTSTGLERAGRRPSAWWFPILSPDGKWFKETWKSAQFSLQWLSAESSQTATAALSNPIS